MKYVKPLTLFQDLVKRRVSEKGRLLGLSVGDKHVAVAVSDADIKIASPLSILHREKSNIDLMALDFQDMIHEYSLTGFIFGYPLDSQTDCPHAMQVKLLIDDLGKTGKLTSVNYTFWNESFASKSLEIFLKPLKMEPLLHKTSVYKFTAVAVLQGYLDFVNGDEKLKVKD